MDEEKILLVYQSKRGSAERAALWISEELDGCEVINLKAPKADVDPSAYDTIVIGSGIQAGNVYGKVKKFIEKHRETLLQKDLALFITHLEDTEEGIEKDFTSAFDAEVLSHARVRAGVGGRLQIDKLNVFLRMIMKKVSESRDADLTHYDSLSQESCRKFARQVLQKH